MISSSRRFSFSRMLLSIVAFNVLLPSFTQQPFAQEQTLETLLAGVKSLKADVVQLIVESNGGVLEESTIKMQLKKPNGFYWETIDPFPELIVTNGIKLWNYQPDLEQVVIEDWNIEESELAAQLLSGRTESLEEDYEISHEQTLDQENQFTLLPLASDSIYTSISIRFMSDDLDSIYMNSKNGEQTVWQFTNIEKNIALDDAVFSFTPPDNIDVIENNYVP